MPLLYNVRVKNITTIIFLVLLLILLGVYYFSRVKTVTNYPSKGTDIIALGDSLVAGVGSKKGNDFVSLLSKKINQPIVNLGRSGDTTADGVSRLKELDAYKPKVVIVLLGGNDYLKKVPITETRKNLSAIIENVHARGGVVLLLGVRGGILRDSFEEEFEDLSKKYNTAYVPNVLDGLLGNTKFMSDSIHPNDIGYKMISEKVFPVLAPLVK